MIYPLSVAFAAGFLTGLLIMAILNVHARRRICSECLASAWTGRGGSRIRPSDKPDYHANRPPSAVKDLHDEQIRHL